MSVRVLPAGPEAMLLEVGGAADAADLHRWLVAQSIAGVRAIVPAARTVLVQADAGRLDPIRERLADYRRGAAPAAPGADPIEIPVEYDGEDLALVADSCRLSVAEVVRRHRAPTYTAAFCGFAPGFAYLIGGDPALQLPRRVEPRTRVPAGSVAIAGEFTAIYPSASPGGWRLLGHTDAAVWRTDRDPPALLAPGTRVRFVPRP